MSDAVSKKAILEWIYSNGYFSFRAADMLADEFEKGTFDIPSTEDEEMKVLFDDIDDLEGLDAEFKRLREAEGRYREETDIELALLKMWVQNGIEEIYKYKNRINWYRREGLARIELFNDLTFGMFADLEDTASRNDAYVEDCKVRVEDLIMKRQALSPSGEHPGPSMNVDHQRITDLYKAWNEMDAGAIYSPQTIASIIADVAMMCGVNVEEDKNND